MAAGVRPPARPPARSLTERRGPRPESRPAARIWLRAYCVRVRACVRVLARASVRLPARPLVASLRSPRAVPPPRSGCVRARSRASFRACACPRVRVSVCPPRLELRAPLIPCPSSRPYPLCGPLGEAALIGGQGPKTWRPPSPASRNPRTRPSGLRGKWEGAILQPHPLFFLQQPSLLPFLPRPPIPGPPPPQDSVCKRGFCWAGFSPPIHIHKSKSQP